MSGPVRQLHTEPEFVTTLELHLRDRLPGIYAIAGEVAYTLLYDGDLPSILAVGDLATGIMVEVPASLMPPPDLRHLLPGAWVVVHGYAVIVRDERSLVATRFTVAHWPALPDQLHDPETYDD